LGMESCFPFGCVPLYKFTDFFPSSSPPIHVFH
jgi:hypothetical protein